MAETLVEGKVCSKCLVDLPLSEFTKRGDSDRLRSHCKGCRGRYTKTYKAENPERAKEIQTAAQRRHYESNTAYYLEKSRRQRFDNYGITQEEYDDLLTAQGGVCAICRNPETATRKGVVLALAVDHCHTTGKVRGLLCVNCNQGIGKFRDDVDLLAAAINYLRTQA